MVDAPEYENDHQISQEDMQFEHELAKDHGHILGTLSDEIGTNLALFVDIEKLPVEVIEEKAEAIAKVIRDEADSVARIQATERLIGGDSFNSDGPKIKSFEALKKLFINLPHENDKTSGPRGEVANAINAISGSLEDSQVRELLEIFKNEDNTPADLGILYLSLANISGTKHDAEIQQILKEGLRHPNTIWDASDVARAKHYADLLPNLKEAQSLTDDPEVKARLQKTIDKLGS